MFGSSYVFCRVFARRRACIIKHYGILDAQNLGCRHLPVYQEIIYRLLAMMALGNNQKMDYFLDIISVYAYQCHRFNIALLRRECMLCDTSRIRALGGPCNCSNGILSSLIGSVLDIRSV